jgi:HK97 family phage portal protein
MALWPRTAQTRVDETRAVTPAPNAGSMTIPSWGDFESMSALYALRVPAFNRGVRLISGTVAQLPLNRWTGNQIVGTPVLDQFETRNPRWVTMQSTVQDLVLYGRAYWLVTLTDAEGFPRYVQRLPTDQVSEQANGIIRYDSSEYRLSDPTSPGTAVNRVIKFTGFNDGVLLVGLDVIDAALSLEIASKNYASAPAPTQILKNTSNYELSNQEIDDLLLAYSDARKQSSVAYLNGGVDLTTFGYSANELQLVEARNQSAIQIARLLNLDPFWVGAGVPGSALTYQNRVDMRQDLVDLTLSDYLVPIEQRLSMWDFTPTKLKSVTRFDTSEFLRANLDTRSNIAINLHTAGIIDRDEARTFISDQQTGGPA